MRRGIRYADAVALVGGDSPAVVALDRVLGGALLAATGGGSELVAGLLGARGEAVRVGNELVGGLRDRLRGISRFDRTQRLAAAHTVIAVTAFFSAVDQVDLPFDPAELALTGDEQLTMLGAEGLGLAAAIVEAQLPVPDAHRPYEVSVRELRTCYESLASGLVDFATGLALWDRLDETARARAESALRWDLPELAVGQFEELYQQLAQDVPEFGWWRGHIEHQATRTVVREQIEAGVQAVGRSLATLETMLRGLPVAASANGQRAALGRAYQVALTRPILSDGDAPAGIVLPTLDEGYVDPDFRIGIADSSLSPANEAYWSRAERRDDLAEFLAGHLTAPLATQAPLLVLGQPGAGKSVLTRILAARLPSEMFMPVRVELREVPADADVQHQIEYAIRATTGLTLDWPQFVAQAGSALPVVLLDGFDELLQATGVSQSDYLERVTRFQQREADQGRPLAVLVTSRIAVSDRARVPAGAVLVRLEPFRTVQIDQWLTVWNRFNAASFAARGITPLSAGTVERHHELASQPLLLLLLALYDGDSNGLHALQDRGDDLDETDLYERLLTAFAQREVRKSFTGVPDHQLTGLVDKELLRLSVVAFAMFNRGRQWVSTVELDRDLDNLVGRRPATQAGFRMPLSQADTAVGRFFFIQRAQAIRDGAPAATYEFLHATFGEYLVARLTHRVVQDLAEQERAAASAAFGAGGCQDGLLYALLSFAPLCSRGPVLNFLRAMAARLDGDQAAAVAGLPTAVLTRLDSRTDDRFPDYRPVGWYSTPSRYGRYALNLVLLAAVYAGQVRASDLIAFHAPEARSNAVASWRRHAQLWQSVLDRDEWRTVLHTVRVERVWEDQTRDLVLTLDDGGGTSPGDPVDMYWSDDHAGWEGATTGWFAGGDGAWQEISRQAALICDRVSDLAAQALEPLQIVGPLATIYTGNVPWQRESGQPPATAAVTVLHALIRLWAQREASLTGDTSADDSDDLASTYDHVVKALSNQVWPDVEAPERQRGVRLVLHRLAADAARLPLTKVAEWVDALHSDGLTTGRTPLLENVIAAALANPALSSRSALDVNALLSLAAHVADTPTGYVRIWVGVHEAGILLPGQQPPWLLSTWDVAQRLPDVASLDPPLFGRASWLLHAINDGDAANA